MRGMWTVARIAAALGDSRQAIQKAIDQGKLKPMGKIGRAHVIDEQEAKRWIAHVREYRRQRRRRARQSA